MKSKQLILASAVAVAGLTSFSAAQAVTVWAFSYSGPGIVASGTFTTAGAALAPEPILSISGLRNGVAITGLVGLGGDPNFSYDNLFTIAQPNFSDGGVLFSQAVGGFNTNVYFFNNTYNEVFVDDDLNVFDTPIAWSVAVVPEPATVLTMLAGLGLLCVATRKARALQ